MIKKISFAWFVIVAILIVFVPMILSQKKVIHSTTLPSIEKKKAQNETSKIDQSLSTEDWKIIWHDEFTGDKLDLSKWNIVDWASNKNSELQYYSPENVSVGDGYLRLLSKKRSFKGREYTSGAVETANKLELLYGKVEIRARLPKGQGIFPAFWMVYNDNLPEIDIMEMLGHKPNEIWMVYHWLAENRQQKRAYGKYVGPELSEGFHTFGIEWEPDKIVWLINGKKRFQTTKDVPGAPLYLYINTAIGGEWPGNPDATTKFPQTLYIDYVRIWEKNV